MAKKKQKKSPFPFQKLFKKSSLSGLICLLLWTLYQLVDNIPVSQPLKIPASNAPVELYSNQTQDDLTSLYQQAIAGAKESITLVIYALTDTRIIETLQKKSETGIPVYIVCDAKASPGIRKQIPKANIVRRIVQGHMHQKILIVDNKQLWLGSANLTSSSLNIHGNLVMGIEHPELAQLLTVRAKSMDEDGCMIPLLHRTTTTGPQTFEQWVLPDDRDQAASKRIIELLKTAKKSIKVAMFTWTRMDFTQELISAAKRGIRVEAVVDRYQGSGAGSKIVQILGQAGIPIRLNTGQGLLHHKFAYIDDAILVNGSANWTQQAFKSNDDYFVVIYPLTSEQQKKMDQLWNAIQQKSEKPNKLAKNESKKINNLQFDD